MVSLLCRAVLAGKAIQKQGVPNDVFKQFLMMSEASIDRYTHGTDKEKLGKLIEILKTTKKDFNMGKVAQSRHTQTELTILSQIANNMYKLGDAQGSFDLYRELIKSMDNFYKDCPEKRAKFPFPHYAHRKQHVVF